MPKDDQILHIPAEVGYPASLRLPSKFLTQKVVVDEKTGATADAMIFFEFIKGEPFQVADPRDFAYLQEMTWPVGGMQRPLFRSGKPKRVSGQTREDALEAQVEFLTAQINTLMTKAGISTEEDAPVKTAESL